MTMRISDQLRAAKVLAVEHNTKREYAVDAEGQTVDVYSPRACRFCAWGAACRVAGPAVPGVNHPLMSRLDAAAQELLPNWISKIPWTSVSAAIINDELGVEAVAQMFDRAIRNAEREEGSTCP